MEVLCESDYQNVYRIIDGVLLVVDKFQYMSFDGDIYPRIYCNRTRGFYKKYAKGCEDGLKQLIVDYKDKHKSWELPKGTVVYYDRPVKIVPRGKWNYKIKTTGSAFSGNFLSMDYLLRDLVNLIEAIDIEEMLRCEED